MKEYSKEEQLRIYSGISADMIGEVKRQLRCKLNGEQGKAVADVVAKLW